MNSRKSRFVLTNSQQNGILLLAGILFILISTTYYYHSERQDIQSASTVIDSLAQHKLDSLKQLKLAETSKYVEKVYPFNPNFLKEGKAYRLGITAEEFDRLTAYREEGKWINSVEDFKEVTKISDEVLNKISPYFKFPEWVIKQQEERKQKSLQRPIALAKKKDINSASSEELQRVNGIGEKLSRRIINYRNKIGGFRSMIQLKDVYGLKVSTIEAIRLEFEMKTSEVLELIDINKASVIQLADVPYLDYEIAREVFQFIKINEGINTFEELSKIQHFPISKIDRIKLYLTIIE